MSKTVYLVDFENVHEQGLEGMDALHAEDEVIIFFTENAEKLNLNYLEGFRARLTCLRVQSGKQSLDMHLASYLGFLLGREQDKETRYIIISADCDYLGVVDFWHAHADTSGSILRRSTFKEFVIDDNAPIVSQPTLTEQKRAAVDERRDVIRRSIRNIIAHEGNNDPWGVRRIQVSLLCSRLNDVPEYRQERKLSGQKPRGFLQREFPDMVRLGSGLDAAWAYEVVHHSTGEKLASTASLTSRESKPDASHAPIAACDEQSLSKLLPALGLTAADAVAFMPMLSAYSDNAESKVALYNKLCQHFGGKEGRARYHKVKQLLAQARSTTTGSVA